VAWLLSQEIGGLCEIIQESKKSVIDHKYRLTASTLPLMNRRRLCPGTRSTIHKPREKKDLLILLRQEPHTLGSGLEDLEMGLVFRYGQMELVMKVSGKITELMGMESSSMLMGISMKETGLMIKQMDLVCTFM
jgi:hypothetical protein